MEENHYYPFGLTIAALSTKASGKPENKFKYNSKKLESDFDLNTYDYGARIYDVQIGRWQAIDPLSEVSRKWSPYTYCYDNPMSFVDKDGMLAEPTQNGDGVHFGGVEAEGFMAGLQELYNSGVNDGIVQVNTMDWGGGGGPGINLKHLTPDQAIDALFMAANCVEYAYQINKNTLSSQVKGNLGFEINNYQHKLKSANAKKEFAVIVENYFDWFTSTRFFDRNSLTIMKTILKNDQLSPSQRVNYVNKLINCTLQEWQPISALGVAAGFAFLGYGMGGSLAIGKQLPKARFPTSPALPQPKFDINNPNSFNGAPRHSVEKWLAENGWKRIGETKSGEGIKYTNGKYGEHFRIMPGYPPGSRPDIMKTGPYIEISIKGKKYYIPLNGNPTL